MGKTQNDEDNIWRQYLHQNTYNYGNPFGVLPIWYRYLNSKEIIVFPDIQMQIFLFEIQLIEVIRDISIYSKLEIYLNINYWYLYLHWNIDI